MPVVLSCQNISKSFAARPLFQNISFGIDENERIGLIGPNGAGKSTLLKIVSGLIDPDSGALSVRKNARVGYLAQQDVFDEDTVEGVLEGAIRSSGIDPAERVLEINMMLGRLGFTDGSQQVQTLSGGWRKRLALARELLREPDVLLLDEPTNHLDIEGVEWLESMLKSAPFASLTISHDRYFLESVANRIIELNPAYSEGFLTAAGSYTDFLQAREDYLAAQAHKEHALAGQVKKEIEWLRRGPQARTTKANYRIKEAGRLIGELAETRYRNNVGTSAGIDFDSSGRKTRELMVAKNIRKDMGGRTLFEHVDLTLSPGTRLAIIGPNGRGKTTMLRALLGDVDVDAGTVKRADSLRVVFFDQNRAHLDQSVSLKDALCPNGETVLYRGASMHVTGWAKRFLFRSDQLQVPVSAFSGGEQARIVIAQLMLQPADVLILDEPTNDLDIPALEVLEESLLGFPGALILVTHDRYLMDRVATDIVSINGDGTTNMFASLAQWEGFRAQKEADTKQKPNSKTAVPGVDRGARLSSSERKELKGMEQAIESAELAVTELEASLTSPAVASDPVKLSQTWDAIEPAKALVAQLYARWEALERRQG